MDGPLVMIHTYCSLLIKSSSLVVLIHTVCLPPKLKYKHGQDWSQSSSGRFSVVRERTYKSFIPTQNK